MITLLRLFVVGTALMIAFKDVIIRVLLVLLALVLLSLLVWCWGI